MATGAVLEKLAREQPERLAAIRERVQADQLEVRGGCYLEREDALLPVESQLWNLLKGLAVARELLGSDVRVFARKRFGRPPAAAAAAQQRRPQRALLVAFDDAVLPSYRTTVVNWPSPDGKQVEAFTRTPLPGGQPADVLPPRPLPAPDHHAGPRGHAGPAAHAGQPAAPWYEDWLELTPLRAGPGPLDHLDGATSTTCWPASTPRRRRPTSSTRDYLSERANTGQGTAGQLVRPPGAAAPPDRHGLDAGGPAPRARPARAIPLPLDATPVGPGRPERAGRAGRPGMDRSFRTRRPRPWRRACRPAASRDNPGYLLLNPCSFTRRVALELEGTARPLPIGGPVKACQFDGEQAASGGRGAGPGLCLGPAAGPPGTPAQALRMRLADERHVRNEFFEAEVDPATGGLRGFRDQRTRSQPPRPAARLQPRQHDAGQRRTMTSTGPALGEIVSEGVLLDDQDQVLATFRQRFRAWLGRPLLELRIEIYPEHLPEGYPWHAYYGARFAWRDERACCCAASTAPATSPATRGRRRPTTWSCRRPAEHGALPGRPAVPPAARQPDARRDPDPPRERQAGRSTWRSAWTASIPCRRRWAWSRRCRWWRRRRGRRTSAPSGWLFHLDAPNLLLTCLRPGPDGADSVLARLLECGQHSGQAEFRCVRDPQRAALLDARGEVAMTAACHGDAVIFEAAQGDLIHLRAEFG